MYGDWNTRQWTRHCFLPPLKTRYFRILPHDCVSPCCINVRLYILKEGRSESYNYSAALFQLDKVLDEFLTTPSFHLKIFENTN